MKKIIIPEDLKGKALFKMLIENKKTLIAQKKMVIKTSNQDIYKTILTAEPKYSGIKSSDGINQERVVEPGVCHVKVSANAAFWCDHDMDVLIENCWSKSIREKKDSIPHLHDHVHSVKAQVGDVTDFYSEQVLLTDLGLQKPGSTQCLIMESDVLKEYDEKVFLLYSKKKIKQHSIGLIYIKLDLAVNDEEYKEEFAIWNKYISRVINQDFVIGKGYFYAVTEIRVLENSAVLFGCNELTPVLETETEDVQDVEDPNENEQTTESTVEVQSEVSETNKSIFSHFKFEV